MEPPGFPVPLHWLTRTGIAGLTTDSESTVHRTPPPPPLPEPLHWVTVAPVVFAGKGSQSMKPPPPVPEPTHWFEVAADTGWAPGVPALMRLMIVTRQVMGWAASLSDPLHWFTLVTSCVELLVKVPLPGAQGPSVHSLVRVVVDPRVEPLIVLTTTTVHVIPVVAPSGPGPCPLHCSSVGAAWAAGAVRVSCTAPKAAVTAIKARTSARRGRPKSRTADRGVDDMGADDLHEDVSSSSGQPGTQYLRGNNGMSSPTTLRNITHDPPTARESAPIPSRLVSATKPATEPTRPRG